MFRFATVLVRAAALAAAALLAVPAASAQQPSNTLDSIARLAIARNLDVRRTAERLDAADAGVRQARGLYLPSVGFEARYSHLDGAVNIGDFINPAYNALNQLLGRPAFPTNIDATLPLEQETRLHTTMPLYNGALAANLAGARATRDARGAERAGAMRKLDADARIAYLNWARAARAVEIWDATLPTLAENERASQCLVDAGNATPDAVLRARSLRADAVQQRAEAAHLRDAALGALNLLLDRPLDTPAPAIADDELPAPGDLTLDAALASSARREELAMTNASISGARAQQRAAASTFLPSLAVAVDYGYQGSGYHFDRNHDVTTLSLVAQWNLFNGGQDDARRDAAGAAERESQLLRTSVERQIALDVRTAYDAVSTGREALTAADARLAAAERTFTLIDRRYNEGLASHLEWADAETQLTSARLNQTLARYALAARGIDLERAAALRPLQNQAR